MLSKREVRLRYRDRHPDRLRATQYAAQIKKRYGLTVEQFKKMKSRGCQICGLREGRIHMDHDHQTEKVRGVLCENCNRGLGMFHDDPVLLGRAIAYLYASKT